MFFRRYHLPASHAAVAVSLLWLSLGLLLSTPRLSQGQTCTKWASPAGGGTGNTLGSPFRVDQFWGVATPGAVLCLVNGTYTLDSALLTVPSTFAGTASQPITIRALNEGQVLIDGGSRRPIDLQGSYGALIGVNASGGDQYTLALRGTNWSVRKVVLWNNTLKTDFALIGLFGAHNLVEDTAAFGYGRAVLVADHGLTGLQTDNTVRRFWGRMEGRNTDTATLPGATATLQLAPYEGGLAPLIPQAQLTVSSVSSQELAGENGAGSNVLDGNISTVWETQWQATTAQYPHQITLDAGTPRLFEAVRYLPRQDTSGGSSRIAEYHIAVSSNGTTWTQVAGGVFAGDATEVTIRFAPTTGRYLRLQGFTEINGNPWAGIAELNLYGR